MIKIIFIPLIFFFLIVQYSLFEIKTYRKNLTQQFLANSKKLYEMKTKLKEMEQLLLSVDAFYRSSREVSKEELLTFLEHRQKLSLLVQVCWNSVMNSDHYFSLMENLATLCTQVRPLVNADTIQFSKTNLLLASKFVKDSSGNPQGKISFFFRVDHFLTANRKDLFKSEKIIIENKATKKFFQIYGHHIDPNQKVKPLATFTREIESIGRLRLVYTTNLLKFDFRKFDWVNLFLVNFLFLLLCSALFLLLYTLIKQNKKIQEEIALQTSELSESRAEAIMIASTLENILENIPCQVFWKDKDLIYRGGNNLFAKHVGLNCSNDLLGKCDDDLKIDPLQTQDDEEILRTKSAQLSSERSQKTSDGRTLYYVVNKVPLFDHRGELNGMLGISTDITIIKNQELKLESYIYGSQDGHWRWNLNKKNARLG